MSGGKWGRKDPFIGCSLVSVSKCIHKLQVCLIFSIILLVDVESRNRKIVGFKYLKVLCVHKLEWLLLFNIDIMYANINESQHLSPVRKILKSCWPVVYEERQIRRCVLDPGSEFRKNTRKISFLNPNVC